MIVGPGDPIEADVCVVNYGVTPQSNLPVTFRLDSAGVLLLQDTVLIPTLAGGDSADVPWSSGRVVGSGLWAAYTVTAFVPPDEAPENDTASVSLLASQDRLCSYRVTAAPQIDGYLAPGEWGSAYAALDVSDVQGWGGDPQPTGSARARFCSDNSYLYMAAEFPRVTTRDSGDVVGIYLDENNDGQWATDNSEGSYVWRVTGPGRTQAVYCWHRPDGYDPTGGPIPGDSVVSSTLNGWLVFEARLPIGTLPYQVNCRAQGDTMGLWLVMAADGATRGWWRGDMADSLWRSPAAYGDFIVTDAQGIGTNAAQLVPRRLRFTPSPVFGGRLNLFVDAQSPGTVRVSDIAGREVLVVSVRPGASVLDLRGLGAGVYLLRLEAPGVLATEKLVIE